MKPPNEHLADDWFRRPLPPNVTMGEGAFVESAWVFAAFLSQMQPALVLGEGSGLYDGTLIVTAPKARVTVGAYTCINGSSIVADEAVTIGAHCLLAWGSVITDSRIPRPEAVAVRRNALERAAANADGRFPSTGPSTPVRIADNVWIGFDSVVTGGVEIGRGAVIGSKTLVTENVPAYAVVVGNPCRLVRYLEADDDERARERALREFGLTPKAG